MTDTETNVHKHRGHEESVHCNGAASAAEEQLERW